MPIDITNKEEKQIALTGTQIEETLLQAHLSKDAVEKIEGLESSASEIDATLNSFRTDIKESVAFDNLAYTSKFTINFTDGLWLNPANILPSDNILTEISFYAQSITVDLVNTQISIVEFSSDYKLLKVTTTTKDITTTATLHNISGLNIPVTKGSILAVYAEGCRMQYAPDATNIKSMVRLTGNNAFELGKVYTTVQTVANNYLVAKYVFSGIPSFIDTNKNDKSITNYLKGKKVVAIGDSMVRGLNYEYSKAWLSLLAERNEMIYNNYGINGARLSSYTLNNSTGVVNDYTKMKNDADYVLVFAGTNDAAVPVTMGIDSSTNILEFKGALNVLCAGLITKYPNKKIGFITPYLRTSIYADYITAIETICAKYSIPVFNNSKNGGICWSNTAQVNSLTLADTYHLNEDGMKYVSYKYEAFLRSL